MTVSINKTSRVATYLETHCNRLEEGVSHRRTRQVTQLFSYLLTQRRTAAAPTSVFYFCIMTQQDVHGNRQRLTTIWVGTFLVRSVHPTGKILN